MKELTWLHISDIHLCPKHSGWDVEDIFEKLKTDIIDLKTTRNLSPRLIFVTGDIMFGVHTDCDKVEKQYKAANRFLSELRQLCDVDLNHLFLVPGNHDINTKKILSDKAPYLKTLDEDKIEDLLENPTKDGVWQGIIKRLDDYKKFLKMELKADHLLTNPNHLIYAQKLKINGANIGIAGFNTAWSCLGGGPTDKTQMWLGGKWQIKKLNNALSDCDIKIGLSHHPFTWHTEKENSDIVAMLQNYFDFHLHGHEHQSWVEPLNAMKHCRIAAGASYKRSGMLKESGYNLVRLDFEKSIGEIWLRRYDEKAGGNWGPYYIKGLTDTEGLQVINLTELFPDTVGKLRVNPSVKPETPTSEPSLKLATPADIVEISKVGGIREYYPQRLNIDPGYWDARYKNAETRINLLGHSMAPTFSDDILPKWKEVALSKQDLKIKVIVLNPNNEQLHSFIKVQTDVKANEQLKNDINLTIDKIQQIKKDIAIKELKAGSESIIQIRVTDRIIYNSITIFDDIGMITLYSSKKDIGRMSPTFRIEPIPINADEKATKSKGAPSSTLEFYEEEFNRYWATGSHPEEQRRQINYNANSRILKHKERIDEIRAWLRDGPPQALPSPLMLVVHPTNVCSEGDGDRLCPNCTFVKAPDVNREIGYGVLKKIIEESVGMGIKNFEFSGGGEPLEYSKIDDVISLLGNFKGKNDIKCGLLTNGLFLTDKLRDLISESKLFSYVRFHYSEGIQNNESKTISFYDSLSKFLDKNLSFTNPRIGIKVLLKKGGKNQLLKSIFKLKESIGTRFRRINHFQIKPMWGGSDVRPGKQESLDFRNEFFDYLFAYPEDWPEDVQVDLGTYQVNSEFKCELNPLRGVIDPSAKLLICSNYLTAYNKLVIGDLNSELLKNIWGNANHHKLAMTIPISNVCNAHTGCPCRFFRYHEILSRNDNKNHYEPDGLGDFI